MCRQHPELFCLDLYCLFALSKMWHMTSSYRRSPKGNNGSGGSLDQGNAVEGCTIFLFVLLFLKANKSEPHSQTHSRVSKKAKKNNTKQKALSIRSKEEGMNTENARMPFFLRPSLFVPLIPSLAATRLVTCEVCLHLPFVASRTLLSPSYSPLLPSTAKRNKAIWSGEAAACVHGTADN